jgi:NADH dehydrogenase FAD-containing subunit
MTLTVIERRDGVHLKIGAIRSSVRGGDWIDRVRVPLNRVVRNAKTIIGNVNKVDPIQRKIYFSPESNVEAIEYDVLVCATGTHNHSPGDLPPEINTKDGVRAYMRNVSAAIAGANDIVIVGGGASAVEYAGEIREMHPNKGITIISSSANLLSTCVAPLKHRFFTQLYSALDRHHIQVIRGEKVISPSQNDFSASVKYLKGPIQVKTDQARVLQADLVIWAASGKIHNANIYPQTWLNDYGELLVSDTFQLLEDPRVFALGDVSSTVESKQAITLPAKIPSASHNILRICEALIQGKTPEEAKNLKAYKTKSNAIMYLPITSRDGVSQWKGNVFGGKTTSKWKGKDLYCDKFWMLLTDHKAPLALDVKTTT